MAEDHYREESYRGYRIVRKLRSMTEGAPKLYVAFKAAAENKELLGKLELTVISETVKGRVKKTVKLVNLETGEHIGAAPTPTH